jgi:hypothetical protein
MRIHAHTRRPPRVLACLAMVAALLLPTALAAAASARPGAGRRGTCPASHRAKHAGAKHCARHHTRKPSRKPSHKAKKPAPKPAAAAPKLPPALCEDGSAPARPAGGGEYVCEDGSAPFCEDGSEPIEPGSGSTPVCRVPKEDMAECGVEGECGPELACESAEEAFAGPQGCEHGSAFEEEAGEPAT